MSAVDDVEARIYRLQTALQGKRTELQTMLIHQQYNASVGVDQDSQGRSVASLEVKVLGARRVLFRSGFLSGACVLSFSLSVGIGPLALRCLEPWGSMSVINVLIPSCLVPCGL